MPTLLIALYLLLAMLATLAGWRRSPAYRWLKGLPMLLLLLAVALPAALPAAMPEWGTATLSANDRILMLLALLAALAGDLLLLGHGRIWLAGVAAFALMHLAWLVLITTRGVAGTALLLGLLVLAPVATTFTRALALNGALRIAVPVYVLLICLMTSTAVAHAVAAANLLWLPALLFLASDALLAWNRFRRPFPAAQLAILGSYFSAQLLFVMLLSG